MSNPRKNIILNEILFWKQNKLLPEQYCDFLITLYSEGNNSEFEEELSYKKAVKAKEKRRNIIVIISILLVALALLFMLFVITKFVWLTTIGVGIITAVFIVNAYKFAKKNTLIAPFLQVAAALLIFGLSVKISLTYFEQNIVVLFSLLIANCLMWLILGIKLKQMYFTLSGVLGFIIIIGYNVFFYRYF